MHKKDDSLGNIKSKHEMNKNKESNMNTNNENNFALNENNCFQNASFFGENMTNFEKQNLQNAGHPRNANPKKFIQNVFSDYK